MPDVNPQDLEAAMSAAVAGDPLPEPTPAPEAPAAPESLDAAIEPAAETPAPDPAAPKEPEAPAAPAAPEAAKTEPEPDTAVEAEISGLGLKQKAADRMRELHSQAKELAPLKEALEKAGITDVASLPQLVERAKTAEEMVNLVVETGANAEQYARALDYLAASTAASAGNLDAAEKLWEYLTGEMAVVGRMLGREVPGIVDPLAAHADLRDEVDDGNITRARALELAKARDNEAAAKARQAQAAERTSAGHAQQQAIQQGKESLNALGARLLEADPEGYNAKAPYLVAKLREIATKFPPHQWAEQGAIAYAAIKLPAKPAQAPGAGFNGGPVRPTGPTPHLTATYKTPEEALEAGIDAADAGV